MPESESKIKRIVTRVDYLEEQAAKAKRAA
jgi:hypothetical protein